MLYDLEINKVGHYLYATVSGLRTRKTLSLAIKEIGEACRQHQVENVIIDARKMTGRIPILDSLSLIFHDFPSIKGSDAIKKVAVIETEIRQVRSNFFEQVARGRGFNVRVFSEPGDAVRWICDDRDTGPPDKKQ